MAPTGHFGESRTAALRQVTSRQLHSFARQQPTSAEGDPERPELRGARVLRRAGVDVHARNYFEVLEAGAVNQGGELCLRQSTGDSAGPKVYLGLG